MSHLDLAREVLHLCATGDTDALNQMVSEDFQFLGVASQPLRKQEFLEFIRSLHSAFPDFTFHETTASASGNTATIKHTITATHTGTLRPFKVPELPSIPATGKKITMPEGATTFMFKDGKAIQGLSEPGPNSGLPGILRQLDVQMPG